MFASVRFILKRPSIPKEPTKGTFISPRTDRGKKFSSGASPSDYYGDFKNTFQTGIISVKANLSTTTASTLTINNASTDVTYGKYSPYTGQVLHFVDFDPIQRQATRKEKIKFIFDF